MTANKTFNLEIEINNHFDELFNSINIAFDEAIRNLNVEKNLIVDLIDISCNSYYKISDNKLEDNEKSR